MPRVPVPLETAYVEKRLRPLLDRLHADRALRAEFLQFAMERGGEASLLVGRLNASWWRSRRSQFTPFFALVLAEFEAARPASRHPKTVSKPGRAGRTPRA